MTQPEADTGDPQVQSTQTQPEAGTGDPRVDEALGWLAELAELPAGEHQDVFGRVHERLAEVLADTDAREREGAATPELPRPSG